MSDDDDLADMAAFLNAPSTSSSSSTVKLHIGQRVSISVNEGDGGAIWYPATIVDYGDDNPFKVIYDGFGEIYEFSTSQDEFKVLEDDHPRAKHMSEEVSKKQLQKRIWEILRILSVTEAARVLDRDHSDAMDSDDDDDDDNKGNDEEDVARLIRVGLADATKAVRRLEDLLQGDASAQPNAPGVLASFPKDVGGDRGQHWSLSHRLKAYMAPTEAWQYAADRLTLKDIPTDTKGMGALIEELQTTLAALKHNDTALHGESTALARTFVLLPSDVALRDRLKTLQAIQRWRAVRGSVEDGVRPVTFRKVQAEHGKCGRNVVGGSVELQALSALHARCVQWKKEVKEMLPPARSSRSTSSSSGGSTSSSGGGSGGGSGSAGGEEENQNY